MIDRLKVQARLDRFNAALAAVSDIPSELKDAINKNYGDGMKAFLRELYIYTRKDLNKLEPKVEALKRVSQPELEKILNEGSSLVFSFKFREKSGVLAIFNKYSTRLWIEGRLLPGVDINYRFIDVAKSLRNVGTFLNSPDTEYKAWKLSFPEGSDVREKVDQRYNQKQGAIFRTPKELQSWMFTFDKSGYKVDKDKYKKLLKTLREEKGLWQKKTEELMNEFVKLQGQIISKGKLSSNRFELQETMKKISAAIVYSLNDYANDREKERAFKVASDALNSLKKEMDR